MPLFNSLMEGAIIIGATNSRVLLANKSAAMMLGYESVEAIVGADLIDLFSPEDRESAAAFIAGCLADGGTRETMEGAVVTRDGRRVRVAAAALPAEHEGGPARLILIQDITARRTAEQALERSEERFRALIENATDALAVVNMDGQIVYESPSSPAVDGEESVSGLFGSRLLETIHPDDLQKVMDLFEWLRTHPGGVVSEKVRYRLKNGSWGRAEGVGRNLLKDPRVNGIVINYRDITEKTKAEEALRESEKWYRLLADNVADVIFLLDMNLRPTYFSPSVARLTGWSVEEALNGTMEQRLAPRSLEVTANLLARAMADEQREAGTVPSRDTEVELVCKDGSTILADATASFLRGPDGRAVAIVGTLHDITERRVAEDALIDSERRYRLLAENLSDVIWMVDQNLRFTYVSPSVERLLGYTVEEAVAMPTDRIVVPGSFEKAMKVMAEEERREESGQSDRERSVMLELELPRKDGSTVWTENRVSYLRDPEGKVTGFLGVSRDISERRKAQDALKISEGRFRTIFEESPIGAIVFDAAGVPVGANKACARIFGVSSPADLKGPPLFEDPLLNDPGRESLRAGKVVLAEMEIDLDAARRKGAHSFRRSGVMSIRLSVSPLGPGPNGSPSGYLALVEDVTQRRKADEALRASEERFRGLVETTSDWVWEVDRRGAYTYVSPKVSNVLGYDSRDMVGKTPFDFMPLAEARRGAAAFAASLEKQEPFAFLENVMRHKDGHPVVMETSGVPFFAPDGKLAGYRGVGRDITERKETARRLEQSLRKLERTMEAIIQAISTTMETRDPYTAGHQKRVTQLASLLAKEMGLPAPQVAGIRVAGLLHDIGKISIPTEILSKPGQLTTTEMAIIKLHSSVGYDILKSIEFQWPVADIVLQHHERLNGSGYPSGLTGDKILVEARILAVADVVEAMSSHRPYRPAVGKDKALEEIARNEGKLYDPVVVKACLAAFNEKGFEFD